MIRDVSMKKERKKPEPKEYREQVAVVNWLRAAHPDILFNADCGGMRYGSGLQAILRGKRMKAAGHQAGFPDLAILAPKRFDDENGECQILYFALFIEMKAIGEKLDPNSEQAWWISELNAIGYRAICCSGAEEAIKAIEEYLA